jgi:hypothetical protein
MLRLIIFNLLLGAVCGLRFRVMILVPLTALAVIQVLFFAPDSGSWIAVMWRCAVLVIGLQAGFLFGAMFASRIGSPRRNSIR